MSELGPWAGLYNWATEKLMLDRMTAERDVLQVLAMRANPLGFCWPGVGYIANLIGRADSTVENALRRLELMDFIRISKTENMIRNRIDVDYQVSPFVLFIAPEKMPLAMELWTTNSGVDQRNVNITTVIKESQPTTGIRIKEQTTGNQHQNQQQQQTAFRESEKPGDSTKPGENAKAEIQNSGNAAIPTAATPQSPNPSPVPPPPSPLVAYPDPLPDEAAEAVAARMNAETRYMMAVATARGLVVKYGAATCEAALSHLSRCTGINTPAAFLRSTIEKRGVDPIQDAKIPMEAADEEPWLKYVSGKYADSIQSQPAEIEQESHDE